VGPDIGACWGHVSGRKFFGQAGRWDLTRRNKGGEVSLSNPPCREPPHTLRQVIGLENLDATSTEFRPFKQLIERLNRTCQYHVRPACGFATRNGAVALTTLFVTHYNFLRPYLALGYRVPIPLPELDSVATL